jgi:hypothetical protein
MIYPLVTDLADEGISVVLTCPARATSQKVCAGPPDQDIGPTLPT